MGASCRALRLPWLDVLVQAEQVGWVVAPFQICQTPVLRVAIRALCDAGIRLLVDVVRLQRKRGEPVGGVATPGKCPLVVLRAVPGALGYPIEFRGAAR